MNAGNIVTNVRTGERLLIIIHDHYLCNILYVKHLSIASAFNYT